MNKLSPNGLKAKKWREANRERFNDYHREYYHRKKSDPDWLKARCRNSARSRRKTKYGINHKEFLALVEKQDGKCAVCGDEKVEMLRVDHDHATGKIRALLCANCNSGMGFLKEDPVILRQAASYLEAHTEKVR